MELQQGGNVILNTKSDLRIEIQWQPIQINGKDVDASCFILRANGKVSSDADMIFYNQSRSTDGTVELIQRNAGNCVFKIQPSKLNSAIDKLAFVTTIHDAQGTSFSQAQRIELVIADNANSNVLCRYAVSLTGRTEAALIIGEIYRKNTDWKFRAVGQGFLGGLAPLSTHYGINIAADAPSSTPSPQVLLEKKLLSLEKTAPNLVSLAKTAQISLKKKGLEAHVAAVGLCMDVSGSMSRMFSDGTVQKVIERVMGLGLNFDDNGAIDIFAFADRAESLGELKPQQFSGAANWLLKTARVGGGTDYAPAINAIMQHYGFDHKRSEALNNIGNNITSTLANIFSSKITSTSKSAAQQPIYILFVTDGDNGDRTEAIKALIIASYYPIFFQFIGIGGGGFSFLKELDNLPGRFLDNANFFALQNPAAIPESELYDKMMIEYPGWVKQAQAKSLIR